MVFWWFGAIFYEFWRLLYDFEWILEGFGWKINQNQWKSMKINENQWKINENQWKSMKIHIKSIFFRIHSVSNVDFDENYAFISSFCLLLHICWRIFNDFGGFLMDLGWKINENQWKSMKIHGKSMKINENQWKSM